MVTVAAALWGWLGSSQPAPPVPAPAASRPLAIEARPLPEDMIFGRVVDGLTGQPVKRSTVCGWGPKLKVGENGHFSLEAHQPASLLVDAPYYDHKKVTLEPGRFQEVRLMPASPID